MIVCPLCSITHGSFKIISPATYPSTPPPSQMIQRKRFINFASSPLPHTTSPIIADVYAHHAEGGRLILIDAATNTTAGAAMIAAVHAKGNGA